MGVATITVEQLLWELTARQGVLQLADPAPTVRAAYRRAINHAIVGRAVPAGFALRHTGRDRGDLTIRLVPAAPSVAQGRPVRVPVPTTLAGAPDAVLTLAGPGPLPGFSPAGWDRALQIVNGLAQEAARRGYDFAVRREGDIVVQLTIDEDSQEFLLAEEQERRNVVDETAAAAVKYDWQRVPTRPTLVPTGRLVIRTPERYGSRSWADRQRWRLEDKIGAVFALAEERCRVAATARHQAADHASEQRRIWEEAVPRAHAQYGEQLNRARLDAQVQAWRRAQDYRHYAAELQRRSRAADLDDTARAGLTDWIAFIEKQAAHLDPLAAVEELRVETPETASATDLDRFMPSGMTVLRPPSPPTHRPPAR